MRCQTFNRKCRVHHSLRASVPRQTFAESLTTSPGRINHATREYDRILKYLCGQVSPSGNRKNGFAWYACPQAVVNEIWTV